MTILSLRSHADDPTTVAAELAAGLGALQPRLVVFFASSRHDPAALGAALQARLGAVPALGCTTAGEVATGAMLSGSVVLMAFDAEAVEAAWIEAVTPARDPAATTAALARLEAQAGARFDALDPATHLGLVLHDGLAVAEEVVMEALSTATNLPFVGASAGDDGRFVATHVFSGFTPTQGASVLALLRLRRPYRIVKTQSFAVTPRALEVTAVDEATRTVQGFNGRPAAVEYAAALGVPVEELARSFMSHPLGLLVGGGEPFVRSPQQVRGTEVVFYCQVKAGMRLHVLDARDIVADTRRDLEAAGAAGCGGALVFNCILRRLELDERGQAAAHGALFAGWPTAGFSTYGESYIGHINQTATIVLFG